jgi:hypothetical protein
MMQRDTVDNNEQGTMHIAHLHVTPVSSGPDVLVWTSMAMTSMDPSS